MRIKFGSSRVVFIFDNYVVKCPSILAPWADFIFGFIQNLTERYWFTADGNSSRTKEQWMKTQGDLARIIYADPLGFFVIMERADSLRTAKHDFTLGQIRAFIKKAMGEYHIHDLNEYNVGVTKDGRMVAIDYGFATSQAYLGNPIVFKDRETRTLTWSYRFFFRPVRDAKAWLRFKIEYWTNPKVKKDD